MMTLVTLQLMPVNKEHSNKASVDFLASKALTISLVVEVDSSSTLILMTLVEESLLLINTELICGLY